jgi:DNA-binding MarR family transcriptional regulator
MNLIDMCDGDIERAIAAVKNKEIMFGGDGGHDGYRYVSYEDLAKELGCAPGEVRDSLDRLSELGYLRVRSRDENGAVLMPNWFGYPKK